MTRATWDTLLAYLPPDMRDRAVVAGGYAADPELADDVDLWVLNSPGTTDHVRLCVHLTHVGAKYAPSHGKHYGGRFLVATIPGGLGERDVQILTTDYITALELVDSFDISTHMVAEHFVGQLGVFTTGTAWTGTTGAPKVLRWTTPLDTLARLEKICERYRLMLPAKDVDALNFTIDHLYHSDAAA